MFHIKRSYPQVVVTLTIMLCALPMQCARAAQVWVGGSRAWPDFIAPGKAEQWRFVRQNADGFYINNFAMRLTDKTLALAPTQEGRIEQLRQINGLFKNKNLIYETDEDHSTDAFDSEALKAFTSVGFKVMASTVNRGTNPARTAILTNDGKLPLYYMFGPWHGEGDIQKPVNADLREQISKTAGAAVDGPVTMWRKDAGKMKTMCYSTIRWCHANGKKFLYLLAPNESGKDFLRESQKLVHDMEDNEANPDIWAVSFYGPPAFRAALETLPETDEKGQPAATFSGTAFWLMHHLRDPENKLNLTVPAQAGFKQGNGTTSFDTRTSRSFAIDLSNSSSWLDLAPLVRARIDGDAQGWNLKWRLGEQDVTEAMNGQGFTFNRELRLEPGEKRQLVLQLERDTQATQATRPTSVRVELMPHPSETTIKQTLNLTVR